MRVNLNQLAPGDRVRGRGTVETVKRITGSRVVVHWEEGGWTPYVSTSIYAPTVEVL